MSAFESLCERLQEWLKNQGWHKLRDIQELAFEPIVAGRNVLLFAPTAGGKTEAALLPLLNRLHGCQQSGVKILYVAPLRALLNSLENRFLETGICASVYFDIFKWHGDVGRSKKLAAMGRKSKALPDVLLTTPESLDVILCSPFVDKLTLFAPLDAVIIDETHCFAGSERGGQLVSVVNRLERLLKRDLQRVCLSATLGNPEEVLAWMSAPSERQRVVVHPPVETIQREVELNYYNSDDEKALEAMTGSILRHSLGVKSIIFEPSRKAAEQRSKDFKSQFSICHVHHSSVDKFWREKAEFDLAQAKMAATVIATCTLELGLDLGDLDVVQQEGEFPSVSSYVQRVGRTGRRQPPQRCVAHVTEEFEFLKNLAIITLAETGFVEDNELPANAYHLLLQQVLMMALGHYGIPAEEIRATIRDSAALRGISNLELDELLNFWLAQQVLRLSDGLLLVGDAVERKYASTNYRDLYVLFDSPQIFEVWYGHTAIGTLDRIFVHSRPGNFVFILAGKWWQVEEVRYGEGLVFVKPVPQAPPPATWIAPRGQVISYELAQQIKKLLLSDLAYPYILQQTSGMELLTSLRQRERSHGLSELPLQIIPLSKNRYKILNYAGDRANLLIAALVSKKRGWNCEDPDYAGFVVKLGDPSDQELAPEFRKVADQAADDHWFDDGGLLAELAAPFDETNASKWSSWLPNQYRHRYLAHQVFDVRGARAWIESLRATSSLK